MSDRRLYRHAGTGIIAEYPTSLALEFPELIEVDENAKPLAYTPIPQSEIDAYEAHKDAEVNAETLVIFDEDAPADEKDA